MSILYTMIDSTRVNGLVLLASLVLLLPFGQHTAIFTPTMAFTLWLPCFQSSLPSLSSLPHSSQKCGVKNTRLFVGLSHPRSITATTINRSRPFSSALSLSDWSDFQALEDYDDDDDYNDTPKTSSQQQTQQGPFQYADENDPQEFKAEIGSNIPAPSVNWDGEPIFLPQGSVLPLSEENVQGVLAACRMEIGTMFGYSAENRGVGITGGVDFVDLDGPTVVLKLHGRFWHQRTTVLERVGKYLQGRIPEIVDYTVEDPWELTDEANDLAF